MKTRTLIIIIALALLPVAAVLTYSKLPAKYRGGIVPMTTAVDKTIEFQPAPIREIAKIDAQGTFTYPLSTGTIINSKSIAPYPVRYIFEGGVSGQWLKVERHNEPDSERQFDPSYTNIESDFKPVVNKLPSGKWEIVFVSEITEKGGGLPLDSN